LLYEALFLMVAPACCEMKRERKSGCLGLGS
jgi:hypothetical protein